MATINLTDRVSVRVTAKQSDQSSQNKETGRNIEKALGGSGLTDAQAEAIGASCGDTIADEDGNLWINEDDIVAAGKAMYANEAFHDYYEGITEGGVTYKPEHIYSFGPGTLIGPTSKRVSEGADRHMEIAEDSISGLMCFYNTGPSDSSIYTGVRFFSTTGGSVHITMNVRGNIGGTIAELRARTETINGVSYSFFTADANLYAASGYNTGFTESDLSNNGYIVSNGTNGTKYCCGALFGPKRQGSLIDWTKSDEEIKRDIKELHETWDVSEHPGASGQGVGAGTYILAGPIEFNDADPVG